MLVTDVTWFFVGFVAGGEKFVEGFKYVILCGEGEAVVADEGLSEGGYGWAQVM